MPLLLECVDTKTRTVHPAQLPLTGPGQSCILVLQAAPGANCVHLFLHSDDGGPSLRVEIDADPSGITRAKLEWHADNTLQVTGLGRVLVFPANERYGPLRLLVPPENRKLDLLFLFDATAHLFAAERASSAWRHARPPDSSAETNPSGHGNDGWVRHLERILEFSLEMRRTYPDLRLGCASYGDFPFTDIAWAPDLECHHAFRPRDVSNGWLEAVTHEQLKDQVFALEHTSGGDFVDALAEALEQCRLAGWRMDSRKLLVISGDSPGNDVLDPPPLGADARVRHADLRQEAQRLHHHYGVEICTIYLDPGLSSESSRRFTEYARLQYRSLATLRTLSWTGDSFIPSQAAQALQEAADGLGLACRRAFGVLQRVEPAA